MITIKKELNIDPIILGWEIYLPANESTIINRSSIEIQSHFSFDSGAYGSHKIYFCQLGHLYSTEKKGLITKTIYFGRRSSDARIAKNISESECKYNIIEALKACGLIERDHVYSYISQFFLVFYNEVNNFIMNNFWLCYTDARILNNNKHSTSLTVADDVKKMFISKFSENAIYEEKEETK